MKYCTMVGGIVISYQINIFLPLILIYMFAKYVSSDIMSFVQRW
jgi:hypothetical protein